MSIEAKSIVGISDRRQRRWLSKKRKVESFLTLICEDEKYKMPKIEKPPEAATNTADALSQEVRRLNKVALANESEKQDLPSFYLIEDGFKAQVNFKFYNKEKPLGHTVAPLFVEDIQHLLLKGILGYFKCEPRWGKFEKVKKIKHVVLFIIDGLSKDEIIRNISLYESTLDIFPTMVEFLTPTSYSLKFATELCGVHLTLGYCPKSTERNVGMGVCTSFKPLSTVFPVQKNESSVTTDESKSDETFSRLHLLLSPIQLMMENFPLPHSLYSGSKTNDYCYTKEIYAHAKADSPLFALDCEMCRMKSGRMEVTRIAVVDEDFKILYNTLVKPQGPVADYLTKYSGVNKAMLAPVKTTLSDVQKHLQDMLPPDAILCGQSLNFDLHALKMIHPYVIDTSVIYNISGYRTKKASLRLLSDVFLEEKIQEGKQGHDPIEDCIATMKLVKLKLNKGPAFGDAIVSDLSKKKIEAPSSESKNGTTANNNICKLVEKEPSTNQNEMNIRFFSKLQNQGKKVTIISDSLGYVQYPSSMLSSSVNRIVKSNSKKVVKHSTKLIRENHLTICHIGLFNDTVDNDSVHVSVPKYINKLFSACPKKTLFITAATGSNKVICENGLCMVCLKNEDG